MIGVTTIPSDFIIENFDSANWIEFKQASICLIILTRNLYSLGTGVSSINFKLSSLIILKEIVRLLIIAREEIESKSLLRLR